ncbi:MAG: TolC family protein [Polyangiaceae bacterium]
MPYRRSLSALFAPTLLATLVAASVQAAPAKPVPVAAPTPAPAAQAEPTLPDVSDPLLEPPPPPTHVLSSWQQGLALVRDQSVNMRLARANVLQAEAAARQALAPALPQLSAQGTVNYQIIKGTGVVGETATGGPISGTIPDPATAWKADLTLRVPVFYPKVWYDHGSAKDAVDAARLSTKETERQVVAGVADLIVSVVTAERLSEVARTSLSAALSTVDLTKRRAALGASNTLDVLRVEGEASLSRSQVVTATEALIRAREALGTALGSAEAWGVTPDIQLDSLAADAQRTCSHETDIDARTDVRAARANVGVAERRLKGIDYAYLPTVDAVSSVDLYSPVSGINNRHETWSVGGILSWNLYDGGLRGGQRDSAKAAVDVAQADLAETKRGASLQVTQALRQVQVAEADLAVAAKTREIDSETARLSKISFLNGSGTSFDLVTTESLLRVAETDLAVKEFTVTEAKIAALLALSTCNL